MDIKTLNKQSTFMKTSLKLSLLSCSLITAISAHAASFQVLDLSAATLGSAHAGTTVSDGANVQAANPAATAFFTNPELSASFVGVFPRINYATNRATNFAGMNIIPSSTANSPARNGMLPNFYLIYPINKQFSTGFSITTPFAFKTVYDDQSVARYFATESKILSFNFNPSIAIKPIDNFAVGLGLDIIHFKAQLDETLNTYPLTLGFLPSHDFVFENKASDTNVGWNMGLLWKATNTTDIGFGYHSKIRLNLQGDATVNGLSLLEQFFVGIPGVHNSSASASLTLPDYATASIKQKINSWFSLLGDITYTHWSVIKNITINYSGGNTFPFWSNLPPAVTTYNFRNTWRVAFGQEYQLSPIWKLKTGIAYEQSPVRDEFRDARLPDNNRIWVSAGSNFKFTKNVDLDVGYAHVFVKNADVNLTSSTFTHQQFFANYTSSANLFGAQINYHFA